MSMPVPGPPILHLVETKPHPSATVWDPESVLRRAIAREPEAISVLFRRYAPRVHGMLRRMLGPGTETEDLVQTVFMRLFSRLDRVREPGSLDAFVIGIAIRVARKELTARMARRWLLLSPTGWVDEDIALPQLDDVGREALRHFFGLLDRLTPESRTVFVLRHIEGMELKAMAEALEVSLATVKRRLERVESKMATWIASDPALRDYKQIVGGWLGKETST